MKPTQQNDKAEHILYKTYWRLCLSDVLFHLGYEPTKENKELLHNFHKRIFRVDTISNESHDVVSEFITNVCTFWATEFGIFVRTNKHQPLYIEDMDLFDIIKVDGKETIVWDLL